MQHSTILDTQVCWASVHLKPSQILFSNGLPSLFNSAKDIEYELLADSLIKGAPFYLDVLIAFYFVFQSISDIFKIFLC